MERSIYITVKIDVEAPQDLNDSDIVSELDYNFKSFDENVKVIDSEIRDINTND